MKKREIYAIGRPSLENLTPSEKRSFPRCLCVLSNILKKAIAKTIIKGDILQNKKIFINTTEYPLKRLDKRKMPSIIVVCQTV